MDSKKNNKPVDVVLYLQVHQPWRLNSFGFFDIGQQREYFDELQNSSIAARVAAQSYLPVNDMLINIIRRYPNIKISLSISGTAMDQFHQYCPPVLESFKRLLSSPQVEILGETAYHSLSGIRDTHEFEEQILLHTEKLQQYFGVRPSVFRNTELIYDNKIGDRIAGLGFQGVLIEGVDGHVRNKKHHIYNHPKNTSLKLLPRDYRLSDEIAFRYMDNGRPMSADNFITQMKSSSSAGETIMLGMDYETFGEHKKSDSGIIGFLEDLLVEIDSSSSFHLITPSEAFKKESSGVLNIAETISWADQDRNLSAWLGNDMQQDVFNTLCDLETNVKSLHDNDLLEKWRRLMSSDHFYYLSTKKGPDGEVHAYFSPYASPYEAFMNVMNVVHDLVEVVKKRNHEAANADDGALRAEAERRHHLSPVWAQKLEHSYEK